MPGLQVVAHVEVGAPVKVGAELGAAAEAAGGLPEHLRRVARLFRVFFRDSFSFWSVFSFFLCVWMGRGRGDDCERKTAGTEERDGEKNGPRKKKEETNKKLLTADEKLPLA